MTKRLRGRPPIDDEPSTARIAVRVTAAQRLELRRVAHDQGVKGGMSGVVREAVGEYIADSDERTLFRRARR
jgi:hypothetical protein